MIQRVFGDRPRQFMLADDLTPAGFARLSVQGRFSDRFSLNLCSPHPKDWPGLKASPGKEECTGQGQELDVVWGSRALLRWETPSAHTEVHFFKSPQVFSFPKVL